MSELICPNCGSKVNLPEHSSFGCGITLAKDTDNNKYYLNMENTTEYGTVNNTTKENKGMGKVTERLNTLKAAGVDTSNFFSVLSPSGDEVAMKWENGIPTPVDLDALDPTEREIYANGYVKNTKLHRRWIMSQMFQALNSRGGFTEWLKWHGYDYQWKMTIEELRVMSKIEGKDAEAFTERSQFFTKSIVTGMLYDYLESLEKYVYGLKEHKCKGIPYYKIPGYKNVFKVDVPRKVLRPVEDFIHRFIRNTTNYASMYDMLKAFYRYHYIRLPWNTQMSASFVDAYKGEGAYYTLKNMIMFHDVSFPEYKSNVSYKNAAALDYLKVVTRMSMNHGEGYKVLALLKATIEYNNFDFYKRLEELGVR